MAATANATGLLPPSSGGLRFPPCGVDELAEVLRPADEGGALERAGSVEVVSSLHRDGTPVERDLRWGVYATFRAPDDYVRRCFREYGLRTDSTGSHASMYKPFHLIGLELGVSVASVALRAEPTGCATGWRGDVVAVAKRTLEAGDVLDGEGGFTVWGKLVPADVSVATRALPLGLAHRCRLRRTVAKGDTLAWGDVEFDDPHDAAIALRLDMQRAHQASACVRSATRDML